MEKRTLILITVLISLGLVARNEACGQSREVLDMNGDWKFIPEDITGAHEVSFDDSDWRYLNLPHDWSIEGEFSIEAVGGKGNAYLPAGTGWYRKSFTITTEELKKHIWIAFDGVYMDSDVWINGNHLGNHPNGYTGFNYELDNYLQEGKNTIAVRVNNSQQPNSRWYSGSGIYRDVKLFITDKFHIDPWGVFISTNEVDEQSAEISIVYSVTNGTGISARGILRTEVLDPEGRVAASKDLPFRAASGANIKLSLILDVPSPRKWSTEDPFLYSLRSAVIIDNREVDNVITDFGIRTVDFDVDRGLILNGKPVKINGVALHHDGGSVGAAVPDEVWIRRLNLLKQAGCNGIRTAHNPPSTAFLDLCDKMGFLVMEEAFDEWKEGKVEYGYHRFYDEWAMKDLSSMIMRDRNHPSVIMWSLGNEILEQRSADGPGMLRDLKTLAQKLDPGRPVTAGCDKIGAEGPAGDVNDAFLEELDIVGYNYVDRWNTRRELLYSIDKMEHPDRKIIGTENRSINGNRGDYSLGDHPGKIDPNYNTAMMIVEDMWKFVATRNYVIGDFLWTGVDHFGEPEWPNKSTEWGIIDYCGFPKDAYYFYKSQWTEEPMIHLFPHWNWSGYEGVVIPVLAYTNCDTVELFLNGKSYGEKRISFPKKGMTGRWKNYEIPQILVTTNDLHLSWDVPYEAGTLIAVGKKDGRRITTKIITTGPSSFIGMNPDKEQIRANARDICQVVVEMRDEQGNIVPDDDHEIEFSISGLGKILGVGNGDPYDHLPHKSNRCNTYHGLCLVTIQSAGIPGEIVLSATSGSLEGATINIKSEKVEYNEKH